MTRTQRSTWTVLLVALLALIALSCAKTEPLGGKKLRLSTTTSLTDSGLLEELLPAFEKKTGYHVEVSAVGSGKALAALRAGGADVAITHSPADEQAAVATGDAGKRTPCMHNEFIIVGPAEQASVVAGTGDAAAAMRSIATSGRKFISRGDDSGTYQRERALWKAAGIAEDAPFIVRLGAGMGATLARASEEGAFTLSDRATYLAKHKDIKLAIVFQGDDALKNTYSVIEPKASGKAGVNADGARALTDFVRSPEGRALIGGFGVKAFGEPLFTPEG